MGDYARLDFAGAGARPGFKPFHVRAKSGSLANGKDVFATIASTSGPKYAAQAPPVDGRRGALMVPAGLAAGEASWRLIARGGRV